MGGRDAVAPFGFVQLEFGFALGPPDGRYLLRAKPGAEPDGVLVLHTLGAPEPRFLPRRPPRKAAPIARATLVRADPFESRDEAEAWLAGLRRDRDRAEEEVGAAVRRLNAALHAHRVAAADPYVRDLSAGTALAVRLGFGRGDQVAEGHLDDAWEVPPRRERTKRSMEAPEERFAAILGARERALAAEELVLRARADLEAGRLREAALQARVALESLLAELPRDRAHAELEERRLPVGDAANAALRGNLPPRLEQAVADAVGRMESSLKRHRLGRS